MNVDEPERYLKITLATARTWYNGNDATLKRLALSMFSRAELDPPPANYATTYQHLKDTESMFYVKEAVVESRTNKVEARIALINVQHYLEGTFNKKWNQSGFFICSCRNNINCSDEYIVKEHLSVTYDMVYFREKKNAELAIKILGTDLLDAMFK